VDHFTAAEQLLAKAQESHSDYHHDRYLAQAAVHAALAQVQALTGIVDEPIGDYALIPKAGTYSRVETRDTTGDRL